MKIISTVRVVFFVILLTSTLIGNMPQAMAGDLGDMQTSDEFAPLKDLLVIVNKKFQGKILEVEMEQEEINDNKIWVYEVKLLTREGNVYELIYNATTLQLLKTEH